ncbi:MAG: acyl carrier protein [Candidatus Solibacter sp.]
MLDRTRSIVSDVFSVPIDQIVPESSPDTIESWDSLKHLEMVLALEQEFGVQFSPEEIEQLLSVELMVALLAEKLQAGEPSNGSHLPLRES